MPSRSPTPCIGNPQPERLHHALWRIRHGLDSGFEDNGDSFIGGFKRQLTDDTSFLYTTAMGRFNDDPASLNAFERGSIHSFILTSALSDKVTGILQYDSWIPRTLQVPMFVTPTASSAT